MLFDETLIKLFDTDIGFKRISCLRKLHFFSISTHILVSVYVPGHTISGMSTVNNKAIE